jgi:hypothetical protein
MITPLLKTLHVLYMFFLTSTEIHTGFSLNPRISKLKGTSVLMAKSFVYGQGSCQEREVTNPKTATW